VKALIESFAKDNSALRSDAERKTEQVEKLESKVLDLSDQLTRIKNPTEKTEATRLVEAFMDASSALTRLADLALNSSRGPAHDQAESFIRSLWDGFQKVKSAFGRDTMQLQEANVSQGEFGDVVAALNDEELAGLME
jgi:dsDNA-specific endonuclease/ATPase MutS2